MCCMLTIYSLLRFLQPTNNQLQTGLFTLIGAFIGAIASIVGILLLLRYYKGKDEKDRQYLLKAVYNALKSEIETNKEFFEYGIGKKLEDSNEPIFERAVFGFEYDIMYKANAEMIRYIPNIELIKAIVRLYGLWNGLIDALRKHSAEVEKYNKITLPSKKSVTTTTETQQTQESIILLTNMMRNRYAEIKKHTELVLQKLNTLIDLQ